MDAAKIGQLVSALCEDDYATADEILKEIVAEHCAERICTKIDETRKVQEETVEGDKETVNDDEETIDDVPGD